jgi:sulfate adenylyltransferase subunit 2
VKHLDSLETEAVYILREVAAQFKCPVLLFSGGKDSTLMIHLALKAFYPGKFPFPLMHIDTGHNFEEALIFRDDLVKKNGLRLIVRKVGDTIQQKKIQEPRTKLPSRNALQSLTLMDAINEYGFDCCIGGGRRDEEKARAKERIFSVRNSSGAWQPHQQRPELWDVYNGRLHTGENMRAFPISNWSEIDVWHHIRREKIALPSLYFAHERKCIIHENKLVAVSEFINIEDTDTVVTTKVRYRTVGDMTCTAAVRSEATTIDEVIDEIESSLISERGETRMDDQISDAGMEDRKMKGYF